MKALFLTKKVTRGQAFACHGGWLYTVGDPEIPDDNSNQTSLTIAGTKYVVDAYGMQSAE